MGTTNTLGDYGEIKVAEYCLRRGYKVAIPFGHDWKYDLIVERQGKLERVQVKTVQSNGCVIKLRSYTVHTSGSGRVVERTYGADDFDYISVVDATTQRVFFLPVSRVEGRKTLWLRLTPAKNNQVARTIDAGEFETW